MLMLGNHGERFNKMLMVRYHIQGTIHGVNPSNCMQYRVKPTRTTQWKHTKRLSMVARGWVATLVHGYFLAWTQGRVFVANSCLLMLVVSSLTPNCEIDIDVPITVLERANKTFAQNADLLL